jgi:hypothetical protein
MSKRLGAFWMRRVYARGVLACADGWLIQIVLG